MAIGSLSSQPSQLRNGVLAPQETGASQVQQTPKAKVVTAAAGRKGKRPATTAGASCAIAALVPVTSRVWGESDPSPSWKLTRTSRSGQGSAHDGASTACKSCFGQSRLCSLDQMYQRLSACCQAAAAARCKPAWQPSSAAANRRHRRCRQRATPLSNTQRNVSQALRRKSQRHRSRHSSGLHHKHSSRQRGSRRRDSSRLTRRSCPPPSQRLWRLQAFPQSRSRRLRRQRNRRAVSAAARLPMRTDSRLDVQNNGQYRAWAAFISQAGQASGNGSSSQSAAATAWQVSSTPVLGMQCCQLCLAAAFREFALSGALRRVKLYTCHCLRCREGDGNTSRSKLLKRLTTCTCCLGHDLTVVRPRSPLRRACSRRCARATANRLSSEP